MDVEYTALLQQQPSNLFLDHLPWTSLNANGCSRSSVSLMAPLNVSKLDWWQRATITKKSWITRRPSLLWFDLLRLERFLQLLSCVNGQYCKWMFRTPSWTDFYRKMPTWISRLAMLILHNPHTSASFTRLYMASSKPLALGITIFCHPLLALDFHVQL